MQDVICMSVSPKCTLMDAMCNIACRRYHKAARQGEAYVNGEGRCSASMTNYYPMPHSQLLSDWVQNRCGWLHPGAHQHCQVWSGSDQRWRPQVVVTYTRSVTFFPFFVSRVRAQAIPVDRFSRTNAQKTRIDVRKCLFGSRIIIFLN